TACEARGSSVGANSGRVVPGQWQRPDPLYGISDLDRRTGENDAPEVENFVVIAIHSEVRRPIELALRNGQEVDRCFPSLVLDCADVHALRTLESRARRKGSRNDRILRLGVIHRRLDAQAIVEKARLETRFALRGCFWSQISIARVVRHDARRPREDGTSGEG